ncbi:MAG: right-handed parallel beta-helix repeat-containing protein [Propionibacteriaceae bacterium]|nr:right-handed parallel beta-helix repeat-containing protein [Propionibacteriaceae bacterium]
MTKHSVGWAFGIAALIAAMSLGTTGCQAAPLPSTSGRPTTAATCAELAARIVDTVQGYVDSFAHVSAGQVSGAVTARQADFTAATTTLRERGESLGCDPTDLADLIRVELGRLTGGTPLQDAVADTFRADPLGTLDPSDLGPGEIPVASAEQLVTAVTRAGSGSTIRLAPGTYALAAPLVALRPITLVGAGDGSDPKLASTITSLAAGAALIAATSGNLTLTDLAIAHTGKQAASVVVVAGGGYDFARVSVTGGVAEKGTGGYGIVLRPSSSPLMPTGDRRALTDVTLDDNDGGGVVIAGSEQPTISGVQVTGSDGCGLCWVEQAAGTASDLSVAGTKIGVRIDNEASPVVTRAQVTDADVGVALTGSGSPRLEDAVLTGGAIGLQATGSGTATLVGNQVRQAKEIGIRLSGTTRTALERNSVSGATKVGIATLATAASTITSGQVTSTGDVGLIWGDEATGTVTDVVIRGPQLGVQLAASVKVDLTGVVADGAKAAALLASGKASGTVTRLTCGQGAGAAVVFTATTAVRLLDSPTCQVFQR